MTKSNPRKLSWANIGVTIVCLYCSNILLAQHSDVVIPTPLGYVKGVKEEGAAVFKGVPYAEMLTDASRFLPPSTKLPWSDTLDCRKFGNRAPQYGGKQHIVSGSENCLSMNIYTSTEKPKKRMPVLVWVHGGSMTGGRGADMDGHAFADNDGIVTITINYRLGVLGFLYLGDVNKDINGNNGLLDLMMALQYIQKNIAAYGGDPKQVTVMGESAGAKLVSTLLLTSQSNGLFKQMILESGGIQCVRDTTTAKAIRQRLMDTLNIQDPYELLNMPLERLIDAQSKVCGGAKGTNYFGPVADGNTIPIAFMEEVNKKDFTKLRFLFGSNKSESRGFMFSDKRLYQPNEKVLTDWFGENGLIIDSAIQAKPKDSIGFLLTEYMYAMHTHRLTKMLSLKKLPIWLYRFDYDANREGAAHGAELAYVWYRLSAGHHVDNPELAKNVHRMWVNFIQGKSPAKDWKTYSGNATMKVIDEQSHYEKNPIFYEDAQFPISCFRLN